MKNKEIEEILNERKIDTYAIISKEEAKMILSHIEQLEKENKILRENAEHNDKVVDKVNWEINILKNNRDKAIKYIEEKEIITSYINGIKTYGLSYYNFDYKELLDILKGDSDE